MYGLLNHFDTCRSLAISVWSSGGRPALGLPRLEVDSSGNPDSERLGLVWSGAVGSVWVLAGAVGAVSV